MSTRKKWIIATSVVFTFILLLIYPIIYLIKAFKEGYYPEEIITEFTIADTLDAVSNQTAHIILLGGQSNATGVSSNAYLKQNVSPQKYEEYENGYDNVYINYINENGNTKSEGFINAKLGCGFSSEMFGPELGLAEKLHESYPNEKFFIIKYAYAGANLNKQWLSPASLGPTGKLYTGFINFVKSNIDYLIGKGYNINLNAMCWMQGESDSGDRKIANKYETYTLNFAKDVRKDLAMHGGQNLLFVDAFIDNTFWKYHDIINGAKLSIANRYTNHAVVDTVYHGLTTKNEPADTPDTAHYDSLSELKLGQLFAGEILSRF